MSEALCVLAYTCKNLIESFCSFSNSVGFPLVVVGGGNLIPDERGHLMYVTVISWRQ
jgi:hypothetical protein